MRYEPSYIAISEPRKPDKMVRKFSFAEIQPIPPKCPVGVPTAYQLTNLRTALPALQSAHSMSNHGLSSWYFEIATKFCELSKQGQGFSALPETGVPLPVVGSGRLVARVVPALIRINLLNESKPDAPKFEMPWLWRKTHRIPSTHSLKLVTTIEMKKREVMYYRVWSLITSSCLRPQW